ncbi:hypothetical protein SUGI_0310970 [Cryptomeria japonica]|uniref:zinc finger protein SHOOT GRAVITROPISM 5 n=1 Tax=Cryptomeria japonica TaxID=3369 RepID=UPI002408B56A|nr:zinc finger protein SHOOT GRAVITROPISM 5 [Cryptomeria japonica]GLJ17795.1 hypothetical protein SUGI_0310970 [Cryptomeria japonica]
MTALPSPGTAATSLYTEVIQDTRSSSPISISATNSKSKRKRRPAGTPDPDAEVVALSPKTLLESDRYVCEICNQGFQRDQNLQMHRRRHKVPWKLLKRPTPEVRKRVYICPDKNCMHHNPCHALGDLVGIKKHFRRKHSIEKQWKCEKCSKGYAVQSDYKAHLKTCGTRGHSCDCGRVFSRVESFIEHQDHCNAAKERATLAYNDSPSQPSLPVRKRISNEDLNGFGFSSSNTPFNCGKFQDQYYMNMEQQRELQLISSNAPETALAVAAGNNGGTALVIDDHIRQPATDLSVALERYNDNSSSSLSTTEEASDMSQSGAWLQLSIGSCTHYEKKQHVKTGRRATGLTLSLQNISLHSIQ